MQKVLSIKKKIMVIEENNDFRKLVKKREMKEDDLDIFKPNLNLNNLVYHKIDPNEVTGLLMKFKIEK